MNKTGGSRLFFGICFQFSLDIVKICLEKVGFQSNKTKKKKEKEGISSCGWCSLFYLILFLCV